MDKRVGVAACAALSLVAMLGYSVGGFDNPSSDDTDQQFSAVNVQREDTPNDPDYDCAELDELSGSRCSQLYDQRYDLFGFASSLTRATALYRDPADAARAGKPQISGLNVAGAWKIERGDPAVSVAILDTGIRWNNTGLRTQLRLNRGELPLPQRANGSTLPPSAANLQGYDVNGNGAFDVDDYANDARVDKNAGPNGVGGQVDGQDLVRAFSDSSDGDANGYIDDIAGWDFFDDDNDPYDASSYFAAGNHGTGRAEEAVERGNDGAGSIGICPNCQFVPIRIWDTFVSDGNTFGLGIVYAADNGISVVEGANGSLYHSAFTEAAVRYAYDKGLTQVYSGDDLNTGNHNYPAAYTHTLLIEGTVPDSQGLGTGSDEFQQGREFFCGSSLPGFPLGNPLLAYCPGSNLPVLTYFRSANTAQFGGKSSISMWGSTGSQNTGRASGAAALLISAGRRFLATPLSADEARIILEQTAEDVTPPNTLGAGTHELSSTGWDSHFGWGRVNLGAAVQAVKDQNIPPEASIATPDWYAPLVGDRVSFTGLARAPRHSGSFDYKFEWGLGQAPSSWTEIKAGTSSTPVTDLGTLQLAAVRAALAGYTPPLDLGDAVFAPNSRHPLKDQFTVRLTVTVAGKMAGVDRKVLTAIPDGQGLVAGFPKRLGSGGEAPIRYADLDGDGVQELIVPAQDGLIHAYRPDGSELPGWPVATEVFKPAARHLDAPAFVAGAVPVPREPPRGATIADLGNDGRRQVVTAAGVHVYVFEADGSRRAGFPVKGPDTNCAPDKQKQENLHPKCGFVATPALAWLDGRAALPSVIAPSLDGNLYAWNGDGSAVSWSPRRLWDERIASEDRWVAESINNPAIGDLNGDGKDDIVIPTNEVYPGEGGAGPTVPGAPDDVGFGDLTPSGTRVYAINGATGALLNAGWPVSVEGIIQNVLPFIGPGQDPALVRVGGEQLVVLSATGTGVPGVGSGLATYDVNGGQVTQMSQVARGPLTNATDVGGLNLFESAVIGDLLDTGSPAIVKYQLGLGQVLNLLLVGQNVPYNHMIGAWDAESGSSLPAFPTVTDDYQFLSSSTIAQITPPLSSPQPPNPPSPLPPPPRVPDPPSPRQIVAGTGLGLLHAYDGATGRDVAGFPKVTGGWLFAPAALSDTGRMAAITREGFLFEWQVNQPACQTEWPDFRHDEQGSGNYDRDGTPPAAPSALVAEALPDRSVNLSLTAPGDDRRCGRVDRYEVRALAGNVAAPRWNATLAAPPRIQAAAAPAGAIEQMRLGVLPPGPYTVMARAFDETGNGSPLAHTVVTVANSSGVVTPIGSAGVLEPVDVGGGVGETLRAGSLRVINNSADQQTVRGVTLALSQPDVIAALRLTGTGVDVSSTQIGETVSLHFETPVILDAGAGLTLELRATIAPPRSAALSLFNTAHAGIGAGVQAAGSALGLLLLLAAALRRPRGFGVLLLTAGLMLVGCGGGDHSTQDPVLVSPSPGTPDTGNPGTPGTPGSSGGNGSGHGGGASSSTTISVASIDATAGGAPVQYANLPVEVATVTRQE